MRLDEEKIRFIYENINALFPLNVIVSSYKEATIKRFNTIDIPEHIKIDEIEIIRRLSEQLAHKSKEVVYFSESNKKLRYMGFGIFENDQYEGAIVVGPYLNDRIPSGLIDESERFIYEDIPLMSRGQQKAISNMMMMMVNEILIESICIEDEERNVQTNQLNYTLDDYQMNLVGIKTMYKFENELIHYVGQGNTEKALDLMRTDRAHLIDKINRFPDNPIRNIKNLCIVLNTLLRKAVETNGVDAYFMHILSGDVAVRIEKSTTIKEIMALMSDMITEYCNMVNEYNTRVYSELIAKAITYIKLHFREELGLTSIAKELFIHPTYLAKKFKLETDKTVSEYINEVRIKEAQFMLKATEFKVEDIAYYVGYNDKKYFSKTFKKTLGISPSEFRQYHKEEK